MAALFVRQHAMRPDGLMGFSAEMVDLSTVHFTPDLLRAIPRHLALRHRALPISETINGALCVALADPSDIDAIDSLTHLLHREIAVRTADEHQLGVFLTRLYGAAERGDR